MQYDDFFIKQKQRVRFGVLRGLGQSFSPVFWAKLTAETEKKNTQIIIRLNLGIIFHRDCTPSFIFYLPFGNRSTK